MNTLKHTLKTILQMYLMTRFTLMQTLFAQGKAYLIFNYKILCQIFLFYKMMYLSNSIFLFQG